MKDKTTKLLILLSVAAALSSTIFGCLYVKELNRQSKLDKLEAIAEIELQNSKIKELTEQYQKLSLELKQSQSLNNQANTSAKIASIQSNIINLENKCVSSDELEKAIEITVQAMNEKLQSTETELRVTINNSDLKVIEKVGSIIAKIRKSDK